MSADNAERLDEERDEQKTRLEEMFERIKREWEAHLAAKGNQSS